MAKDAYYFRHDSNASNDPKMQMAEAKYEHAYQWYFKTLEVMRSEDGYKIIDKPFNWNAIAVRCHTTSQKLLNFYEDCVNNFELFKWGKHGGTRFLYSDSFLARMAKLDNMRKQRIDAVNSRWDKERD